MKFRRLLIAISAIAVAAVIGLTFAAWMTGETEMTVTGGTPIWAELSFEEPFDIDFLEDEDGNFYDAAFLVPVDQPSNMMNAVLNTEGDYNQTAVLFHTVNWTVAPAAEDWVITFVDVELDGLLLFFHTGTVDVAELNIELAAALTDENEDNENSWVINELEEAGWALVTDDDTDDANVVATGVAATTSTTGTITIVLVSNDFFVDSNTVFSFALSLDVDNG